MLFSLIQKIGSPVIHIDYGLIFQVKLKRNKYVALSNLNIYYTWKNKKSNSKSKLSGPRWGEVFELSDGLYSVSDIQDYFIGSSKNLKTNR